MEHDTDQVDEDLFLYAQGWGEKEFALADFLGLCDLGPDWPLVWS